MLLRQTLQERGNLRVLPTVSREACHLVEMHCQHHGAGSAVFGQRRHEKSQFAHAERSATQLRGQLSGQDSRSLQRPERLDREAGLRVDRRGMRAGNIACDAAGLREQRCNRFGRGFLSSSVHEAAWSEDKKMPNQLFGTIDSMRRHARTAMTENYFRLTGNRPDTSP